MLKRKTLKNGLRVILAPQEASLAATVLTLVEAGSEYESREVNGLSHFLEHLAFKGTVNRPKPGAISEELESLGAEYNAFTGQEYTGYWAKAQNHKLPQILNLISDLYLNPVFNSEEIEKERGVIIEEINMYEDMPARRVEEYFFALLYGDQPAGWDIAGRKEVIMKLTRDDFVGYRSKHYVAPATAVVVAGNFPQEEMEHQVGELFGHLETADKPEKAKTIEKQDSPGVFLKYKKTDQTNLVLGVRAFDVFDERRHALQVLSEILGGGMSSRLFVRVRGEMGAAYHIRANSELFLDHGFLQVVAGVDSGKVDKVIGVILEECRRMAERLVDAKELQKAKDHMIGGLILGLETSDELAAFYGSQEILNVPLHSPEESVKMIESVTAEEVQQVAKAVFSDQGLNLAMIGPHKQASAFEKLLKFPVT